MKQSLLMLMLALCAVMGATCTSSAQLINVSIAGRNGGIITRKEIMADSIISVREPGTKVISFQMNHFGPYWDAVQINGYDNTITPEMRKELKHLHHDDLLFFINIKARNANGDTLWADPIKFKIK